MVLIHRFVGYPTAFVIAPIALLAFTRPDIHRSWGKIYFYLIIFLYLTGTWFTVTQHAWNSWGFYRNLSFNFFGFSMLIYAYRAIRLFVRKGEFGPGKLDVLFAWLLTVSVICMLLVAIPKNTAMRVFTLLGSWLCFLEWRELRLARWPKSLLYQRHQRYILASYFYVLTVVSIVHLQDEMGTNARWLWPALCCVVVTWLMTGRGKITGTMARKVTTRNIVWSVFSLTILFGAYVLYDLLSGAASLGQT